MLNSCAPGQGLRGSPGGMSWHLRLHNPLRVWLYRKGPKKAREEWSYSLTDSYHYPSKLCHSLLSNVSRLLMTPARKPKKALI
jgi:hypothetical protein